MEASSDITQTAKKEAGLSDEVLTKEESFLRFMTERQKEGENLEDTMTRVQNEVAASTHKLAEGVSKAVTTTAIDMIRE